MNELERRIAGEMENEGVLSFARFMERALYEPLLGYYEKPLSTPGRTGDFYTSVSVGPLFGRLLAFQFCHWLRELGSERPVIGECGAQTGQLARDILDHVRSKEPSLWERLEYWILESSPTRQNWQRSTLAEFGDKVKWVSGWQEISSGALEGIVFSNELLDALPCHCFSWNQGAKEWRQRGVMRQNAEFAWTLMPSDDGAEAPSCPVELIPYLPDGFLTETSPSATAWWSEAAARLGRGWLVTADYGLSNDEFFAPHRAQGTLRAFRNHRIASNVLSEPGEQDLTAHINFSNLTVAGEQAGLATEALVTQEKFLTGIAAAWLQRESDAISTPADGRQFRTLTHPQHLGRDFQFLVQSSEGSGTKKELK